jgi:hypothetical protein
MRIDSINENSVLWKVNLFFLLLAMWGCHDHSLSMRKALNETLITSKPNNSLYRRWRWTQSVQNKKVNEKLIF